VRAIARALESTKDKTLNERFFLDLLGRGFGPDDAHAQLDTAIDWGRYGELFDFDANAHRRYPVVANQTLGGADLANAVHERITQVAARPEPTFHVVVPATPPQSQLGAADGDDGVAIAGRRLQEALVHFGSMGARVSGEVGVEDPMQAIRDALAGGGYDAIIISTLPAGVSRWLRMDLPHRVEREFDLPVVTFESATGSASPLPP
jgi:hypothetical protein